MVKFFRQEGNELKIAIPKEAEKRASRARALNEMGWARLFARLEARVTNSISVKAAASQKQDYRDI